MFPSWIDEHVETFIRPHIGHVPNVDASRYDIRELSKGAIDNLQKTWDEVKRRSEGRMILLPGRDVFLFEVLARMENYPTIFRPDISKDVAPHVNEDYTQCLALDTGYRGTVPKAMGIKNFLLISYSSFPVGTPQREIKELKAKHQVFPEGGYSMTSLSGTLECIHKYWERGYHYNGKIIQTLFKPPVFKYAAMTTLHVAKNLPTKSKTKGVVVTTIDRLI